MPKRLAYISPQFPSISMVFEQNEMLGLLAAGISLELVSCRTVSNDANELHDFARPLLPYLVPQSISRCFIGAFRAAIRCPGPLFHNVFDVGRELIRDPSRAAKHIAALVVALNAFHELRKKEIDWIHADFSQGSATAAMYLSRLLKRPFSVKAHAYDIHSSARGARERESFYKKKLEAASRIFVVSTYGIRAIEQNYGTSLAGKLTLNRVSVRLSEFAMPAAPQPAGALRCLALGRLVEKKGFADLVEAIKLARKENLEIECDIWGDGPLHTHLEELVKKHSLVRTVRLRGYYQNQDLPKILSKASALVVPSRETPTGDIDGIPTVIFEAMSASRPVIASRLSGIPEVVAEGRTGFLFEPGNPADILNCLKRLIASPKRLTEMGENARSYVEIHHGHYHLARQLLSHLTVIDNQLKS